MLKPKQIEEKEHIVRLWERKRARYKTKNSAEAAGCSYAALAESLGVSRQRVYNQMKGPAPMSQPLRERLEPMLGLEPYVPPPKPEKKTGEPRQRGDRTIVPSVILDEPELVEKWLGLVAQSKNKTTLVRELIRQA